MTKTEIAVLVIGSGLAAGLVQSIVTLLSGRWERRHRSKERQAVEKHEAALRREAAHDKSRDQFLPKAESFVVWADRTAHDLHWQEVGDVIDIGTKKFVPSDQAEVLDLLRDIKWGHPTKPVRDKASNVYDSINGAWSAIVGDSIPDPTFEQALVWLQQGEDLVELIHSPEASE